LTFITRRAGERPVGKEALPFLAKLGVQIGDNQVKLRSLLLLPGKVDPGNVGDSGETSGVADRDQADPQPAPLQVEVDDVVPEYADQEAHEEMQAAIVKAREEKEGQDEPIGDAKVGNML
jgi:hypothetical protein